MITHLLAPRSKQSTTWTAQVYNSNFRACLFSSVLFLTTLKHLDTKTLTLLKVIPTDGKLRSKVKSM